MSIKKLLKQALSYQNKDNKAEALLLYEEILKIDPVNLCALNNLGMIYQESGDFIRAEEYYKKVLKSKPQYIETEYNLGLLYKQQGQKEEAVNVFESIYRKAKRRSLAQEVKQELKELTNNNYDKCDRCGDISILETTFRYTIRGRLCPGCSANPGFLAFLGKMIWLVFGIVLILLMFSKSLSKPYIPVILFINIIIFFLWFILLIFFHEFAHALAFYYLGGKVFEINIGHGSLIFQVKINKKFIFTIRKIPDGGRCTAAFEPDRTSRFQKMLSYSAGLFFHLVLIIISIPLLNPSLPYYKISIIETLFLANVLHFINNVIPRTIMIGTQKFNSDSRNIIKTLKHDITDEERKAYFIIECNYLLKWKSYSELLKKSEEALSHWHNDIIFDIFKTIALPYLGKRNETVNILKDRIEFINKSPTKDTRNDTLNTELTKSILYNNLAYNILCLSHNSHHIKEALEYSKYAYIRIPWVPGIKGTMGFAFLQNGEISNCIPLLKKSITIHEDKSNKATNHALLASAYAHKDNLKKSKQHMKIALNLDPDEFMVNKIYTEINTKFL